jgi:hypothetical protein
MDLSVPRGWNGILAWQIDPERNAYMFLGADFTCTR